MCPVESISPLLFSKSSESHSTELLLARETEWQLGFDRGADQITVKNSFCSGCLHRNFSCGYNRLKICAVFLEIHQLFGLDKDLEVQIVDQMIGMVMSDKVADAGAQACACGCCKCSS